MIGPPYNNICNILNTDGHLQLMSLETADAQSDSPQDWALYDLSPDFVPEKVILSDHYWEDHRRLSAEGKIKHSVEQCPERTKPIIVKMWSPEQGWKDIALPPIANYTAYGPPARNSASLQ